MLGVETIVDDGNANAFATRLFPRLLRADVRAGHSAVLPGVRPLPLFVEPRVCWRHAHRDVFGKRWFGEFESRVLVQSHRCRQRIFSGPGIDLEQIRRKTQPATAPATRAGHDCFRFGFGELVRNLNVQPLRGDSNSAVVAPDHQPDVLGSRRGLPCRANATRLARARQTTNSHSEMPRSPPVVCPLPQPELRCRGSPRRGQATVVWCDLDSDNVIENLD